jgi:hypothetical protein
MALDRATMNTNIASARYGKAKRAAQIGMTATTLLTLCMWLGPNRALFVVLVAGGLWARFATCRRYPAVAWMGFLRGLFGR